MVKYIVPFLYCKLLAIAPVIDWVVHLLTFCIESRCFEALCASGLCFTAVPAAIGNLVETLKKNDTLL